MTILPFLMGASGRPDLKSELIFVRTRNSSPGQTETFTIPASAVGPATLVFMHLSRTNSGTGDERLETVNLTGQGSFTRRAANDTSSIATNPSSVWTRDVTGLSGTQSLVWDYQGSGETVSCALGLWVVYGRPHSLSAQLGGNASRPAGGITMQGIRDSNSEPAAQGYTVQDANVNPTGLYARMGRWFGPTAGTHPGGTINITFTPT